MIFILSQTNFWLKATSGIEKRSGILSDLSNYVLTKRSAAIWRPAEFHRVCFGSSATGRGFSLVLGYGILSIRFLKSWADTLAMTFVRRSDGEDTELKFCE